MSIFYALKAPETRRQYPRRLISFCYVSTKLFCFFQLNLSEYATRITYLDSPTGTETNSLDPLVHIYYVPLRKTNPSSPSLLLEISKISQQFIECMVSRGLRVTVFSLRISCFRSDELHLCDAKLVRNTKLFLTNLTHLVMKMFISFCFFHTRF
jgi:hypothetical protein